MSRPRTKSLSAPPAPAAEPTDIASPQPLDTQFLETLIGYNARRAALSIISVFLERMSVYGVRPVDFSVLSLIRHNPGITSRQLCAALGLLPPNLVLMLNQLEERQLVEKRPHPTDGRAVALYLSEAGHALMADAESTAAQLERDATSHMTDHQRSTLMRLLKLVYQPPPAPQRQSQRRLAAKVATSTRQARGHPRRPANDQ
jgi:DNA-binding MarR family transcriptional regulator